MKLELLENKKTLAIILVIALIFIGSAFYLSTEDDVSIMDLLETLSLGAISGNVETVKPNVPDYHNYYGTVHNPHLMDSSSGWGEFEANKEGGVYFSNSNDPFTKADCANGYISFKLETMDVSDNDNKARVYLDVYPDGQSTFFITYAFYSVNFDGHSHWKTVTTYQKLSFFDKNDDGIINHAVLRHSANDPNWVRIYELQWIITFEEPDPCLNVDCDDKCLGEYWATDGECNPLTGKCEYANKEKIHGKCEYDACIGVDCSDTCIGKYRATNGHCEGGECIYNTQEKIDGLCGYIAPEPGETPTPEPTEGATPTPTPTGEPTPEPTEWPTGEPTPVATSLDEEDSLLDMIVPDIPGEVPEDEVPEEDILDKLRENIYLVGIIALVVVAGAAYVISTGGLVNKKKK